MSDGPSRQSNARAWTCRSRSVPSPRRIRPDSLLNSLGPAPSLPYRRCRTLWSGFPFEQETWNYFRLEIAYCILSNEKTCNLQSAILNLQFFSVCRAGVFWARAAVDVEFRASALESYRASAHQLRDA